VHNDAHAQEWWRGAPRRQRNDIAGVGIPIPQVMVPEWDRLGLAVPSRFHRCTVARLVMTDEEGSPVRDEEGELITVPLVLSQNLKHLRRGVDRRGFCACGNGVTVNGDGTPVEAWGANRNLRRDDLRADRGRLYGWSLCLGVATVLAIVGVLTWDQWGWIFVGR